MSTIRKATIDDVGGLNDLDHRVWPKGSQTNIEMWRSRIQTFSEGVIIYERNSKILGVIVLERLKDYPYNNPPTWYQITNNGNLIGKHVNDGLVLFGVALSVDPAYQNSGIGSLLVLHTLQYILLWRIEVVILGSRLMNYYKYKETLTPDEYVNKSWIDKRVTIDPEISFYRKFGFQKLRVVSDYFSDQNSENYGLIITWRNRWKNSILRYVIVAGLKLYERIKI